MMCSKFEFANRGLRDGRLGDLAWESCVIDYTATRVATLSSPEPSG